MSSRDFINEQLSDYSVEQVCRAIGVSKSNYHRIKRGEKTKRAEEDEILKTEILKVHKHSQDRYGYRPMYSHLQQSLICCGRDRTRRLMKELGIQIKNSKCFKPQCTDSNHTYGYSPNLVKSLDKNELSANQVWVSDTTYIRQNGGWAYLAVVMDLFTKRVIGWSVSENNDTELVINALRNAIQTRGNTDLQGIIHHRDRGSTYASHRYKNLLKRYNMRSSMSAKGNCYDTAAIESFFGRYKTAGYDSCFQNVSDVRKHVFEYIEVFYNRYRKHSALNYQSPIEFEKKISPSRGKEVDKTYLNN